jgi:uncharacterized membrane protein YqjE
MSTYDPRAHDVDLRTQPLEPEKSLGDLIGELTSEMSELVRKELELAKTEAKEQASRAGKAGGMFGAAGVGALLALIFLSAALAWGLAEIMPEGFAFLIVGALWVAVAVALALAGRSRLREVRGPQQTVESLKEDVAWARAQKS